MTNQTINVTLRIAIHINFRHIRIYQCAGTFCMTGCTPVHDYHAFLRYPPIETLKEIKVEHGRNY